MNDTVRSFLFQWWIFMLNFNQVKIKEEDKLVSLYEQLIDYDENDVKLIQYLIFFFPLLYNSFVHWIPISYSNETILSFFLHQNNKMQHILLHLAVCILFLFFLNSWWILIIFYLQDDLFIERKKNSIYKFMITSIFNFFISKPTHSFST